jgi:hypothetical protein
MQSEGVVVAIISTIIPTVVATSIVVTANVAVVAVVAAAVRAFGSPLLGLLIPNVEVVIISFGGRSRARATIVGVVATPIILRLGRHLLVVFPLHAWMRVDLRTGVGTFSPSTGLRDAIASVGTRPPQRMRAVLLISTSSLSSHRFASSIDGSLASCFNSKLLGDTMAAAWVQSIA